MLSEGVPVPSATKLIGMIISWSCSFYILLSYYNYMGELLQNEDTTHIE
jgi:hypothetical protein